MRLEDFLFSLLIMFLVAAYIGVGVFFAWALGVDDNAFAYAAVAVLWPVIGFILLIIGIVVAGVIGSVFRGIRS